MRKRFILLVGTAAAVLFLSGSVSGAPARATTEVVVTLKAPPLSAFGSRGLASASDRRQLAAAQAAVERNVLSAVPSAHVRWRYRTVLNGFAVVVPSTQAGRLARVPGVDRVWPNVRYHALLDRSPEVIGADRLWGSTLATAGEGVKIGIIDDGVEASHPFFDPTGFAYPPGFPKGQTALTTPKVIVQRAFAPPSPKWKYASAPFDPVNSFHGTHVAGIAAGDHGVSAAGRVLSGVAPSAQIGNYKALTIPTPGFGIDGNAAEITAAIEAAVNDGMDIVNLSLGEPEVEPSRDLVVHALEGAAAAGVVPVVAAGNDFDEFGFGSVGSPANTPSAITVAAASKADVLASFSSGGPTTLSLGMKPDVTAPGVQILSSMPTERETWGTLQGTSMAAPHVAGAVALLKQRHPTWTPAQIKSALVLTGSPVRGESGGEVPATREGGGLVTLPRADVPLVFAAPTGLSFGMLAPGGTTSQTVDLTDAGGGVGTWNVTSVVQGGPAALAVPATAEVPGRLAVTATAGEAEGDATGFVVLSRGADVRRIPFWLGVGKPQLGSSPRTKLTRPGIFRGTTAGKPTRVSSYRYPTNGLQFLGPEAVYRVSIRGSAANFGVAVLSGRAVPHIVLAGDENRLAGYTALPLMVNPYFRTYGQARSVSGVVLPKAGDYDIVFDTRSAAAAGPFSFRFWIDDTTPPALRVTGTKGQITVTAADAGSGVDPQSIVATLDGQSASTRYCAGRITIPASRGQHRLVLQVSDFQEAKNMEDVPKIRPNTATLAVTVRVR